jgi:hypothetical protein
MKYMRLFVKKQPCLIIFSTFWQENLELYLRQYPSLYLLLSTVCCLVLLVSKWGFSFVTIVILSSSHDLYLIVTILLSL